MRDGDTARNPFSRPAPTRWRTLSVLTFTLLSAACADGGSGEPSPAPGVSEFDSAGIHIIDNPDPATLPVWGLSDEVELTIGAGEDDPTQQLFQVRAGLRLRGGRVALLNGGTWEVRLYDRSGRYLVGQGRRGDGPEEYRVPTRLLAAGSDSLMVWDGGHRRVTVLAPDGSWARSFTPAGDLVSPDLIGTFTDGSLLFGDRRLERKADGTWQNLVSHLLRYDRSGEPTGDTLGVEPWLRMQAFELANGAVEGRAMAFASRGVRATSGTGAWIGDAHAPRLHFREWDGRLTRLLRWPDHDRSVTDAVKDRMIDDRLAAAPNDQARDAIRRSRATQEYADTLPAYQELRTDERGDLWVRWFREPGTDGPDQWWVFDAQGRALRRVELPAGTTLLWSDGERVLVRLMDDLHVERVQLQRLVPASPPGT